MTDTLRWPRALAPRTVAFNPRGMTISGPIALNGQSQVVAGDAGYWVATLGLLSIATPGAIKKFRALRAQLDGGASHILVPAFDKKSAPWPYAGGPPENENQPQQWSDGAGFSDGSAWYNPAILIYLAEAAELRAGRIVIDIANAGAVEGGEYFSLVGGGMHVVKRVVSASGTERTIDIWPPLRGAVPAGRRCEFERPVCKMRLLSDEEMDLSLRRGRHGMAEMNFIEVF